MLKVIGYVRVSLDEMVQEGCSLQAQAARMRAYAELYQVEIVDLIEDPGISAKSLDRPGLKSALARLKRKEADGILVAKLDRLSRNVGDWNYLITNYFGERPAKVLLSVGDQVDTRSASGRMILNMLMTIFQWERETIGERTRDALKYKKSVGEKTGGRIEYGYKQGPDKHRADGTIITTVVPCPLEQATLATMQALREQGLTLEGIANELMKRGLSRRGGSPWSYQYVNLLLKRMKAVAGVSCRRSLREQQQSPTRYAKPSRMLSRMTN